MTLMNLTMPLLVFIVISMQLLNYCNFNFGSSSLALCIYKTYTYIINQKIPALKYYILYNILKQEIFVS